MYTVKVELVLRSVVEVEFNGSSEDFNQLTPIEKEEVLLDRVNKEVNFDDSNLELEIVEVSSV